jgi:hypothetical protein
VNDKDIENEMRSEEEEEEKETGDAAQETIY